MTRSAKVWLFLAVSLFVSGCLSSCASDVSEIETMLWANLKNGQKAAGRPTVFEATLLSVPIGEGVGSGRQFEHDDFSKSQWNLREITPGL